MFEGLNGECLLDTSLWRPCRSCKRAPQQQPTAAAAAAASTTTTSTTTSSAPSSSTVVGRTASTTSLDVRPTAPMSSSISSATCQSTDPPAPVEIEPLSSYALDAAVTALAPDMQAHTPMDCSQSADCVTATTAVDRAPLTPSSSSKLRQQLRPRSARKDTSSRMTSLSIDNLALPPLDSPTSMTEVV